MRLKEKLGKIGGQLGMKEIISINFFNNMK